MSVTAHPLVAQDFSLDQFLEALVKAQFSLPQPERAVRFAARFMPPTRSVSHPPGAIRIAGALHHEMLDLACSGDVRDLCRDAGVTLFHGIVALTSSWLASRRLIGSNGALAVWRPTGITESCFGRIVHPHPVRFPNDATLRERLKLVVPQCTAAFDESDEPSFLMSLPSREASAGLTWDASTRQPDNGTSGRFQAWDYAPILCPFKLNFAFARNDCRDIACRVKYQLAVYDAAQVAELLIDWKCHVQSAVESGRHQMLLH